jgi:hypothetical protein
MSEPDDAQQWHEMAQHLVQGHGADENGLITYAPTLDQLRFAHADTHVALASINALSPDPHTHPLPMDAGWPDFRQSSYRPFLPSASARKDPLQGGWPLSCQTGLPQTNMWPATKADLTDWAALRSPVYASADQIKRHAAKAAARWLARADFPGAVQTQTQPPIQSGRGGPAASRRRAPSTASARRQARPGRLR